MATISTNKTSKTRRILVFVDGKRCSIPMGKITAKNCLSVKLHIEKLVSAKLSGDSYPDETSIWLSDLDSSLRAKLERIGLVTPRVRKGTVALGSFIDEYLSRRNDIKPGTRVSLGQGKKRLIDFFGKDRRIDTITPGDADQFKQNLLGKLSPNTVARTCGMARQYMRAAVRSRLLSANPFEGVGGTVRGNPDRMRFIERETIAQVMNACPDEQWRLIVALCRFGGLRCPSEVLSLRWDDIDWDRNRIRITSPKTERQGKAHRIIPLFPELRRPLLDVYDRAEPGTEWIITRYRLNNLNLRQQFARIIRKAGLEPWPKPFQNMRSSRETELIKIHPMHVVCYWLGHTKAVAQEHYLQVTDSDFDRAIQRDESRAQNPAQRGPAGACEQLSGLQDDFRQVLNDSELSNRELSPAKSCNLMEVGRVGFEPT